jgi:hypothetical protein
MICFADGSRVGFLNLTLQVLVATQICPTRQTAVRQHSDQEIRSLWVMTVLPLSCLSAGEIVRI